MCAKYGRSRMNGVHTISLADSVSCPAKVIWSKKKAIFVQLLCQLLASQLIVSTCIGNFKYSIISIITTFIDYLLFDLYNIFTTTINIFIKQHLVTYRLI